MPDIPVSDTTEVRVVVAETGQEIDLSATYFYVRNCSEKNITVILGSGLPGKDYSCVVHRRQDLLLYPLPEEWSGTDGKIDVTYSDTESIYVAAIRRTKARQEKARA